MWFSVMITSGWIRTNDLPLLLDSWLKTQEKGVASIRCATDVIMTLVILY